MRWRQRVGRVAMVVAGAIKAGAMQAGAMAAEVIMPEEMAAGWVKIMVGV
jgi:hypothetical protein